MPDTCSPLATSEYVFLLASYGTLTCYDAKKGEMLWEQEFDAYVHVVAQPGRASGCTCSARRARPGSSSPAAKACEIVGEADLGEECVTSPAFQDGRMYIRGKTHLFCIGQP